MTGSNSNKNIVLALALILLLGLAFRFYIASQDMRSLLPNYLSDDAFCYFKLSQNMAAGLGSSFDGITETNGYHPLYMLFLTVIYSLFGSTLDFPIRLALALLAVFDVLTGLVIYKIMLLPQLGGNRKAALVACGFWIFNPFVISGTFYGIETAISAFFISLAFYRYLKMRTLEVNLKKYFTLGLILGFAILARTDSLFILIAITIDMLVQKKTRGMLLAAMTALIVSSPWFIWSYLSFGMLQQNSGAVLTHIGAFHAGSFLSETYIQAKLNAFYLSARIVAMFLATMVLPLGFVFLLALLRKVEVKLDYRKLLLNFIVLFSLILFAYYPVFMWGATRRYYQPLLMVSALAIGLVFNSLNSKGKWIQKAFVLFMMLNLILLGTYYMLYRTSAPQAWHLDLYETAFWLGENTAPEDRIGGFNFAIMGYYSNRTVMDTLGVMNDEAYHAVLDKRLFEYIKSRDIKYLVDNENTFDAIKPFMGDDNYRRHLKLVYKKPLKERPDQYIAVYEVVPDDSQ